MRWTAGSMDRGSIHEHTFACTALRDQRGRRLAPLRRRLGDRAPGDARAAPRRPRAPAPGGCRAGGRSARTRRRRRSAGRRRGARRGGRRRGERGAARRVELDPQRQAAARDVEAPGREVLAQRGGEACRGARGRRRAGARGRRRRRPAARPPSAARAPGSRCRARRGRSARRWTSAGLARTQPIRRPAQNVLLIEPIVITVSPSGSSAATGAGGSAPSRCRPATASSIDERRARGAGERDELLAVGGRHREPGRVLVVGDHVREPRRGLAQRRRQHLEVPAVRQHRHRDGPGADRRGSRRAPRGSSGARPARGRRGRTSTRRSRRERVQRARGDEHLVGRGRRAARGQVRGDRRAQDGQAGGVVAGAGQVTRELGGGGRERGVQDALGRRAGGAAEVDHAVAGRAGRGATPGVGGQLRPRAGAAAAGQEALVAQRGVRGGRRRAAHAERLGQLALARAAACAAAAGRRARAAAAPARAPRTRGRSSATRRAAERDAGRRGHDRIHAGHFIRIGYGFQGQLARLCSP